LVISFFGGVAELIQLIGELFSGGERGRLHLHEKDDTGRAVSDPAKSRARRHGLPSPLSYRQSKSDRSGRRREAAAKSGACIRQGAGADDDSETSPRAVIDGAVMVRAVMAWAVRRKNSRFTSARSSGRGQSKAFRRGLKTIDHSGLSDSNSMRTASRRRRLMRLRATAFPRAFGVVKPTWGPAAAALSGKAKAANNEQLWRVPRS